MADDDGNCTPELIQLMADLAEGGVGLIITGHAYIHLSYPGDDTERCPTFPLDTDDHDRVRRVVAHLLKQQSS